MKNKLVAGALASTMFVGVGQTAEIVGAPNSNVKKGSVGLALEITEQKLEMDRDDGFGRPIRPYNTDIRSRSLKASYGVSDGTAISFRLGKLGNGTTLGETSNGPNTLRATAENGDLWGIGVETVLHQSGPFTFGLNGRFTQISYGGEVTRPNNKGTESVKLLSGDLGLGLGYAVSGALTAYGGLLLQKLRGDNLFFTPGTSNNTVLSESQNSIGYIGARYQLPGRFSMGVEVHTNSAWGANVGVQF